MPQKELGRGLGKKKLGPDESEKKKCLYFKGKNANKKLMIDTINSKN